MLKALADLKPEWYVPLAERDAVTPTRFLLRPLDGVERLDVSFYRDENANLSLSSDAARAALKHGLQGWEHILDTNGSPLHWNPVDRDANLKRLPAELVAELATEIFVRSVLSEAERKNSLSQPTSQPKTAGPSTAEPVPGENTAMTPTPPDSTSGRSPA